MVRFRRLYDWSRYIWHYAWYVTVSWLPAEHRYIGWREEYYDGPIYCFGFWWFHFYSLGC